MLALAGVWGALQDARRSWRWLGAASLAYGLAVGARPSLLFGAVILLVPVARAWREKRPVGTLLLAATVPIALIGLGLMAYNQLRFDNPLEFGQRYQLPAAPEQQFSPRYLWVNFQVGFLKPAQWSGHFPFVNDISPPVWPKNYSQVESPFGVLTNIPLVWLALALPLAWRGRSAEARSGLRWFLGAVALLFGTCVGVLSLHNSMSPRYEMEFASPLVFLAVIGVLAVERVLAGRPVWRRAARCGWVLLLAFSVAFNWFAGFHLEAQLHCGLGTSLQDKGRLDEAIAQFQKAMKLDPGYAEVYYDLAGAVQQQGNADEAIVQYQKALQIRPAFMQALNNLGNVLLRKGQLDEAITQYQKALQLNPDFTLSLCNLGNALQQKGRMDEAVAQYEKALKINPDYPDAINNLGSAYSQKGELDKAVAQYEKALKINPDFANAHFNLGNALLQKGKLDEAILQYQKTLQDKPDFPTGAYCLGNALLQKGDVDGAITQFQNALRLDPAFPDACCNLGSALLQKGRVDEAVTQYQKAIQIKPDFASACFNLGNALVQKGDLDGAITQFQKAVRISPDLAGAQFNLGNALLQKQNWEAAIGPYRQAIRLSPGVLAAYRNLGLALYKKGQIKEALDCWQQGLKLEPNQADVLSNMAWLLSTSPDASLRDGVKAVALASQASQLSGGGNPGVLRALAAAYAEEGSYQLAVATARRAIEGAAAQKNDAQTADLEREIKFYEAGAPVRDPRP
jgi:tetratricopeptide (TPR) repeat protein